MPTKPKQAAKSARPWAIYARLSKAQDGGLEKVDHQVKLCAEHADEHGIVTDPALVFVDDSLSAWKRRVRRPEWDRMMKMAEHGEIPGILVWEVSRFTRRPMDLEKLIELAENGGMTIDGPGGRYDLTTKEGRRDARTAASQAAFESDSISARCKTTLHRKMTSGKPMGGGRSFGFEKGAQAYRDDEVAVIREVARRMLSGEPTMVIADDLNERGVRTARDGLFTGSNLRAVMIRPRNGGKILDHDGKEIGTISDAQTGEPLEPILDADTYDEVVALVNSKRRGRPPTGRYLLTGIARCGACDRAMNGTRVWRKGEPVRVYRCTVDPDSECGCSRTIRADKTEEIVKAHMVGLFSDPSTMRGVAEREAELTDVRAERLAALDEIEEQLASLEVKLASGEIILRAYERAKPVLDKKLAKARAAFDGDVLTHGPRLPIDPAADYDEMTDDEKRAAISALVTVTINEHGGYSGRYFRPERVVVTDRAERRSDRRAR